MSEDEANKLLGAVNKLNPKIKQVTDSVAAKKEAFGAVKPIVKTEMQRFLATEEELAQGLVERVPAPMRATAEEERAKLSAYFNNALTAMS